MSVSGWVRRNSGYIQKMEALRNWGCQRYPDIAIQRIHRSTFCAATSVNQSTLFSTLIIKRFARLSRALSDHDRQRCWTSCSCLEQTLRQRACSWHQTMNAAPLQCSLPIRKTLGVMRKEPLTARGVATGDKCAGQQPLLGRGAAEWRSGRLQSVRSQRGWNIMGRTDSRTLKGSFASEHSFN